MILKQSVHLILLEQLRIILQVRSKNLNNNSKNIVAIGILKFTIVLLFIIDQIQFYNPSNLENEFQHLSCEQISIISGKGYVNQRDIEYNISDPRSICQIFELLQQKILIPNNPNINANQAEARFYLRIYNNDSINNLNVESGLISNKTGFIIFSNNESGLIDLKFVEDSELPNFLLENFN